MRLRNALRIGPLATVCLATCTWVCTHVLTLDMRDIPRTSVLRMVVDSEITNIPREEESTDAVFSVKAQDGTQPAMDRVRFTPKNMADAVARARDHFVGLGYTAMPPAPWVSSQLECTASAFPDGCVMTLRQASGAEVEIRRTASQLEITKFSL